MHLLLQIKYLLYSSLVYFYKFLKLSLFHLFIFLVSIFLFLVIKHLLELFRNLQYALFLSSPHKSKKKKQKFRYCKRKIQSSVIARALVIYASKHNFFLSLYACMCVDKCLISLRYRIWLKLWLLSITV